MRLINKTQFQARDLRRIVLAGLKVNGMDPKYYYVCVNHRRSSLGGFRGHGAIGGERMWLHLDPKWKGLDNVADHDAQGMRDLAETINHEIAHNRGIRHRDMAHGCKFRNSQEWKEQTEWIVGLPLRSKVAKEKPKADPVATRETHARKMLERHEAKLRRQQRIVRKWKTKVKYYDRKNAANKTNEGEVN